MWRVVNQDRLGTLKACQAAVEKALSRQESVIVDRTNVSVQARRLWVELARRFNAPAVAVQFDVQAEECIARCCHRKKHEGGIHAGNAQSAVTAMAQRLVPPSVNEGFQKVFVLSGDQRQSQSLLNTLFAVHDHKEQGRGAAAVNSSDGVLPNSRMMSPLGKGATEPEAVIGPVLYPAAASEQGVSLPVAVALLGKAVTTPPAAAAVVSSPVAPPPPPPPVAAKGVSSPVPAPAKGMSSPAPAKEMSSPAPAKGMSSPAPAKGMSSPAPAKGMSSPASAAKGMTLESAAQKFASRFKVAVFDLDRTVWQGDCTVMQQPLIEVGTSHGTAGIAEDSCGRWWLLLVHSLLDSPSSISLCV